MTREESNYPPNQALRGSLVVFISFRCTFLLTRCRLWSFSASRFETIFIPFLLSNAEVQPKARLRRNNPLCLHLRFLCAPIAFGLGVPVGVMVKIIS